MNRLIFAALGTVLATIADAAPFGCSGEGCSVNGNPPQASQCPNECSCDPEGNWTYCATTRLPSDTLVPQMDSLGRLVYSPYCDPGWTLVPVATSSGTKQMCAAVGDLKEPK